MAFAEKVSKNRLRKVLGTSFPRSGHHLLSNCLLAYFSENPYFIRTDGKAPIRDLIGAWNYAYCDYYHHCNQVPCSHPATVFQKNHDYDYHFSKPPWFGEDWGGISKEEFKKRSEERYKHAVPIPGSPLEACRHGSDFYWLVQYRDPIPALVSYYGITTQYGFYQKWDKEHKKFVRREVNRESWEEFARENVRYYKRFIRRWVSHPLPNSHLLKYEDFMSQPVKELIKVVEFFDPAAPANSALIEEIVDVLQISPKSNIKKFEFYDSTFFAEIERLLP